MRKSIILASMEASLSEGNTLQQVVSDFASSLEADSDDKQEAQDILFGLLDLNEIDKELKREICLFLIKNIKSLEKRKRNTLKRSPKCKLLN